MSTKNIHIDIGFPVMCISIAIAVAFISINVGKVYTEKEIRKTTIDSIRVVRGLEPIYTGENNENSK